MSSTSKNQEIAEIIARSTATLKNMQEAMAWREATREEAKRAREVQRKKAWQISELARIEEGSKMKGFTISKEYQPAGYGGYLDGYCGAPL